MRRIATALLCLIALCSPALAGSTIDPNSPAQNSSLTSLVVRNNFVAAYNDINNVLGKFAGTTAPSNPVAMQDWVDTSGSPVYTFKMWNTTTNAWVSWATLNVNTGVFSTIASTGGFLATAPINISVVSGTVTYGINLDSNFATVANNLALANIGNGHLLANCAGGSPSEPGNCTWNNFADQAIGSTNGMIPYRTGGSWSTVSTGVSGHVLPFLDTTNTFSVAQVIYTGSSGLPPAISGTLLELASIDGTNSRITLTTAGATALVTGRASLGTLATPLTLTSGTLIASFNATGYDGTSWTTSAANGALRVYAEGTWTNTSHPAETCLSTTPSGSTSIADTFCVHANGGVTIGALSSQGSGTINLASLYLNNVLILDSGANITGPSLTVTGALTTGTNGGTAGTIIARGSSTGAATISAQAAAGAAALVLPTTSGTLTSSGTSPIVVNATTGAISCPTCNTTGANVSAVSNSDGTLTISPTSGAVVASIALGHANTWSASQTFSAAIVYGGVTLNNAVTGTGNMVLGTSPSISGLTVTSSFTATGLVTFGAMASAAVATTANYLSGAASTLVPASVIYTAETTTTFGATTTFDFNTFINTVVTLTGNITTQTLSNVTAGKAGSITFVQDGTGTRTTAWNSIFKFSGGTTPTLSTAASAVDVLFYSCRSATNCPASLVKDVR